MKNPRLFLRVIGACVLIALLPTYLILLDALSLIKGAWVPETIWPHRLMGIYQMFWWLITAAGGFALLVPHGSGKWLMVTSFILSAVGGAFVSWLPGAGYVVAFIEPITIKIALLHAINGLIVICVFWLSGQCDLTWRLGRASRSLRAPKAS